MSTVRKPVILNETGQRIATALENLSGQTSNLARLYDPTATYEKDDLCVNGGLLFKAKVDINTPEVWDSSHWEHTTIDELIYEMQDDLADKVDKDGSKVLTTNQVIITADDTTPPSDTTALWVFPA